MRVAIYARYSSDQQRDASIEDQIRLCRDYADGQAWTVTKVYNDRAVSGAGLLRSGIQALLADAAKSRFDVILAEAMDRLSRDQEDIAGLYKRTSFAGIKIITLAEGEVSNLHIGLKGTMNALFLKDLADKTRRGLRGRIEDGKSGGGNAYGYDVVHKLDSQGELVRGERTVNDGQAEVIRRIFRDYAAGISPKAIAKTLNHERIPGPTGKGWSQSTINGNRERGTGILNNELYIGKLVWNRLRYLKDPDTGKRVSRLNPKSQWIIRNVPELAIIDDELWATVKQRQQSLDVAHTKGTGMWDRRRPRYLFSGLLRCGECGGGFSKVSKDHFGCSTARNKGTCANLRTIRRDMLEDTVLNSLQHHLMDPELCAIFAEEYARHINQLRIDRNAALDGYKAELQRADAELDKLVDAICKGVPAEKVKDRMWALETRKTELQNLITNTPEAPVYIHPNMGKLYRQKVAELAKALNDDTCRREAAEIIRSLVERIVLTPDPNQPKGLTLDLQGALAGILRLAHPSKKAPALLGEGLEQVKLVAGTGLVQEPTVRTLI